MGVLGRPQAWRRHRARPHHKPRLGVTMALATLLFASASSLALAAADVWPREIVTKKAKIIVYQPQLESMEGTSLSSRAAVSVTFTDESEPTFGAVWLVAKVQVDRDERMVYVESIQVPRVRFPDSTPEQEAALSSLLEKELPKSNLDVSLDRVIAGLEAVEHERTEAGNLETAPPGILIRTTPAMLVSIDGEPKLGDIEGTKLMRVMNTAFLIVWEKKSKAYYLYAADEAWYTTQQLQGSWTFTKTVPHEIGALAPPPSQQEEAPDVDPEDQPKNTSPPAIVVVTQPTELVNIDGDPVYTPVADNALMYVSNTDADLIRDVESQSYYLLLSGRWYESSSFDGPWQYVAADSLPKAFAKIDDESEVGDVLPFVAGTVEAQDAVLDAQIPQTASVSRSDASFEAEYDGKPKMEDVEGTNLEYAVNSSQSILKSGKKYYACEEGVWFVSDHPDGPWEVATERPPEIDTVPPSSPVYNTKYVYIYDVTPETVYVGYTAGYAGGYVYGPTIVYGTGYWYPGWYSRVYYPRPLTWGYRVRWSPWHGWGFGWGFRSWTFGIGVGFWSPWRAAWWGPVGFRGWRVGYGRGFYHGRRAGFAAGYAAGRHRANHVYGNRKGVRPANRPDGRPGGKETRDRAGDRGDRDKRDRAGDRGDKDKRDRTGDRGDRDKRDRAGDRGGKDTRDRAGDRGDKDKRDRAGDRGGDRSGGRKNDMYADKDGNVFQRGSDGKWNNVAGGDRKKGDRATGDRGTGDRGHGGGRDKASAGSGTRDRSSASRASQSNRNRQLERDHQARQRGSSRTQSYQRQRSSGGRSGGYGGGSRGGGGRGGGGRGGGGGRRR